MPYNSQATGRIPYHSEGLGYPKYFVSSSKAVRKHSKFIQCQEAGGPMCLIAPQPSNIYMWVKCFLISFTTFYKYLPSALISFHLRV